MAYGHFGLAEEPVTGGIGRIVQSAKLQACNPNGTVLGAPDVQCRPFYVQLLKSASRQ